MEEMMKEACRRMGCTECMRCFGGKDELGICREVMVEYTKIRAKQIEAWHIATFGYKRGEEEVREDGA